MNIVAFQMWDPIRQAWIAEHLFYVDQARKRLLSQFENMEAEADRAAEEHLERISQFFDPDNHDEADFYESANDKGIEFYQLLSDMQERTRLSVIAGMYYEWDKRLREWIARDLRHWCRGENVVKSIWKVDISAIFDFLQVFGFNARSLPGYERMDAMRLVVNVFKHGDGISLDELKQRYPEFVPDPLGVAGEYRSRHLDHTNMVVTNEHLEHFSAAILGFWQSVPSEMWIKQDEIEVPKWFEKAFLKDREEYGRA